MEMRYPPKRGEVYYVRYNNSEGAEEAVGRPVLVMSSDVSGTLVTGVFLTTARTASNHGADVVLTSLSRPGRVICNQINTFSVGRFGTKVGTVTVKEMEAVDTAVAKVLGLSADDKVRELNFEITSLKNHINQIKANYEKKLEVSGGLSDRAELDLYKALYEKTLGMLVEQRIAQDLKESAVQKPPVSDSKVDINRCEENALRELGFAESVAKMIVAARPYFAVSELQTVLGVTQTGYQMVKNKITVGDTSEYREKRIPRPERVVRPKFEPKSVIVAESAPKKVNVNTATVPEMMEKAGMGKNLAEGIRAYRNKNGKFTSLEELLAVPRFGETCLKKYGSMLEV